MTLAHSYMPLNQFALHGIHDRFQAIVGAQFLIDVVQMVAQRLQADVQRLCDFRRIFPLCEKPEDMFLLLR